MADLTSLVNMKPITSLHVIALPNGKFGYAGKVPSDVGYIDATPEKLEKAKFGARFGPKPRSFETRSMAVLFAEKKGFEVTKA